MKPTNNLKRFILIAGDLFLLYATLWLTLLIRYQANPNTQLWQDHFPPFTLVFAGWILIFYISNLYDLRLAVNNARFWQLLTRSLAISIAIAIAFFYTLPPNSIAPKTNLAIYSLVFVVLFSLWRQFYNWSLKSYLPKYQIGIIGYNDQVKELIAELKRSPHLGYRAAFIVNDQEQTAIAATDTPIIPSSSDLKSMVEQYHINTLIFTANPHESTELSDSLFSLIPLKINFISLSSFYETVTGKVPITAINRTWFLENLSEGGKSGFDSFKRTYDFILSVILFVITLPLWLLIGLLIKLSSKGPVFFIQTRLSQNGEPFQIYKFRTMTVTGNDFSPTAKNDKRVTSLGAFLRTTRLDELPQLLNIIKGEMSFVGPRPERPELVVDLEKIVPFYRERMLVKPGVTGWDQISGEYHSPSYEDTMKKLQYDLFYIKNRSIYLDLSIILKTIYTILSRAGI
ncbi:sugar transferase [Candidatus Falkowbacteria bacterium]|nr:sugar transferase [Candidatus Falkowbacteria bacterium]